jgi:hypothetical protein
MIMSDEQERFGRKLSYLTSKYYTGILRDSVEGMEKLVMTAGNPAEIRSVPPEYKTNELQLQKLAR